MTNSIDDLGEDAGAYLIIGSNTTENHPVIGDRIKKAVTQRGAKLVVIDPRRIPIAEYANVYLQVPPGYNVPVVSALMNVIVAEGLEAKEYIAERCENFDEFKAGLDPYTPEAVSKMTGIPAEDIIEAARIFATSKPAAILYAMGITQHTQGTDSVKNLANLAMLTGNVGVPGGGVNPLRGQNNVQGACDMGGLPNVYTGYQKVDDEGVKAKFEDAWKATLSGDAGMKLTEMGHSLGEKIKALYVLGENPMISDPDLRNLEAGFDNLDLLIVQDIFLTETAQKADVVFPATSFAEKDGTFTNTERRVQRIRKVVNAPGECKTDSEIICGLGEAMGYEMGSPVAVDVFNEISALTPSYGGMDYVRIDAKGLQWPCPDKDHQGTKVLHVGKFAKGLGTFAPITFKNPAEEADADYPFVMTTGREQAHYHTGSMTRRSRMIDKNYPEGAMEISKDDAVKVGVDTGDTVAVASRRGEITTKVKVVDTIAPGTVFMTFHYCESPVNVLTNTASCPTAKIPEFKVTAVSIRKA